MISMHLRGRTKAPVRLIGGGVAIFMALMTAAAALTPDALDQRKRDVARASLERLGRADMAALIDGASRAEALTDIHVEGSEAQVVLKIEVTGQPACKTFTTDEGKKIVLDVEGAVNLQSGHIFAPAQRAIVQQVRTSLFAVEPQFVSRVVADLSGPGHYVVERGEGQISLTITNGQANPALQPPVEAKNPERVNKTKATLEAVRKEVQQNGPRMAWLRSGMARIASVARSAGTTGVSTSERMRDGFMVLASRQQPAAPLPAPVDQRVHALARELEMVQASEVELRLPPLARLAQVAPENMPAGLSEMLKRAADAKANVAEKMAEQQKLIEEMTGETPKTPEEMNQQAEEAQQLMEDMMKGGRGKTPVSSRPPESMPPEKPTDDAQEPPPPPKRENGAKQPSGGAAAVGRMKQLISGIAGMPPNPAESGLITAPPQVDAQAVPAGDTKKTESKAGTPEEEAPAFVGDPMEQIISIDLREMDLTNVVALLAQKAQINVIAGTELKGVVTANLKNITLRKAIDTVLRMNNLGIVQEEGIYRIVSYEEAVAAKRKTIMVKLESAKVEDLQKTLQDVTKGTPDDNLISISTDKQTNTLIIAGPEARIAELENLAHELDIAKPATPTVTEAIKINNSEPESLLPLVMAMKSKDIGSAAVDIRSRTLVITDIPVVIEQIKELLTKLDTPVKQVNIETMIVDAVLKDNAQTGADWVYNALARRDATATALDSDLRSLNMASSLTPPTGIGKIAFELLTAHADIKGAIAGQVQASNAKLLANPVVVSVENKKATINITREIPYQKSEQATTGPAMTSTAFKEVGIILNVTPAVSHDDHIVTQLDIQESTSTGTTIENIPVTDKRQTQTTLRSLNGQTIYIGGLRQFDDTHSITKTPILGDIPIVNLLFRTNNSQKQRTELLIFLTCSVLADEPGPISAEQQQRYDELDRTPLIPNSQHTVMHQTFEPQRFRDPAWKYRRPAEDGPLIPKPEKPVKTKTKRPLRPERID